MPGSKVVDGGGEEAASLPGQEENSVAEAVADDDVPIKARSARANVSGLSIVKCLSKLEAAAAARCALRFLVYVFSDANSFSLCSVFLHHASANLATRCGTSARVIVCAVLTAPY